MGEWSVGQWIVGVISLQKMYGLYGLKSIYIGINAHVTDAGQTNKQTTSEDRATQLLICEKLSLAITQNTISVFCHMKIALFIA